MLCADLLILKLNKQAWNVLFYWIQKKKLMELVHGVQKKKKYVVFVIYAAKYGVNNFYNDDDSRH